MADTRVVYGALRSGTTMLRLMLDAHPDLVCSGEHDFLFDYLHESEDGWFYDREALDNDWVFQGSGLTFPDNTDGPHALGAMIEQLGRLGGGAPVLMVHRNLSTILAVLSAPRILHFVRDPRDVARSSIGMGWAGNAYLGVEHWLKTERDWLAAPPVVRSSAVEARYEDLVTNPEAELRRISAAFDVVYQPSMLGYDRTSTYSKPDPGLASQWRRRSPPKEIALVESRALPIMESLGYTPSGIPPRHPHRLERLFLKFQSKAFTFVQNARKVGLRLTVKHRIARLAGLRSLESRASREIANRKIRFLK